MAWLAANGLAASLAVGLLSPLLAAPANAATGAIKESLRARRMRNPIVLKGALLAAMNRAFMGTVATLLEEHDPDRAKSWRRAQEKRTWHETERIVVELPEDVRSGNEALTEVALVISENPAYRHKVREQFVQVFADHLNGELTLDELAQQQWLALQFDLQDAQLTQIKEQTAPSFDLDDMRSTPDSDPGSPTTLLHPNRGWIRFVARGAELDDLEAWLLDGSVFGWWLVVGGGGAGKTRLARELVHRAKRLPGWSAGLLHGRDLERFLAHPGYWALRLESPTLLVVDYAANDERHLVKLLEWCEQHAREPAANPLRLLLLDRVGPEPRAWLDRILADLALGKVAALRKALAETKELDAGTEPLRWSREIMAEAGAAWQEHNGRKREQAIEVLVGDEDRERLEAVTHLRPLFLQLLAIQVQEVGSGEAWRTWNAGHLLKVAVAREQAHVLHRIVRLRANGMLVGGSHDSDAALVEDAMAVMTLLWDARVDDTALNRLLEAVIKRRGRQDSPDSLKGVLRQLMPGEHGTLQGLVPDAIGSAFVATVLADRPDGRGRLLADVITAGKAQPVLRLMLLARDLEGREGFLDGWELLHEGLSALPDDILLNRVNRLPRFSVSLLRLSVLFSEEVVRRARKAKDAARLANALNTHAIRLSEIGRRNDALAPTEEAVHIQRQLAQGNPDAYLPDLAVSLTSLGIILSKVGRRDDALAPTEEAVHIQRQLAQGNPDAYLPNLAVSLTNLGIRLSEVGRRDDALAPTEEAVAIYRQLAQGNPDAYLPDLAGSLTNLGNRLSEVGRRKDALAPTEEAVHIQRQLAQGNPDAYLPDLAVSHGALGSVLGALDRPAEAAESYLAGLIAIHAPLEALPHAFGTLAARLLEDYEQSCDDAGVVPDTAIVGTIRSIISSL